MFNVNFGQNFQSSHQTNVPYRNGTRNLRRRDVCAPKKAPLPSPEMIIKVRNIFQRSPRKSIRRDSLELQMPSTTVWRVARKHLHMIPYKLHLLQHLKDTDKSTREDFCTQMQVMLEEDGFDDRLVFSDEATFHVTGKFNKQNTCIWGTEHPHAIQEHVRDSPKVDVFCAISKKCVYWPFFFEGTTVNSEAYLARLQNWLTELLFEGERADFIFQQDGAPPHWSFNERQYLNATLQNKWIRRAGNDCVLLHWPPRSPDLTPCDFFLWGYVKGLVYVPSLPTSVDDLKTQIIEAFKTIDPDMLIRVWQEMEYRFNVCRVTKSSYIEHL